MTEHWNGGSGGKGSRPRPFGVSFEEFGDNHNRIFGEKKKFCETCGKSFSWCECKKKDDYQDVLSTEDCVLDALDKIEK
jgi:hypothetical protein